MKFDLSVREIFRLTNGLTVLACEGEIPVKSLGGCKCLLINDGRVRQEIVLAGERLMLNPTSPHRALETSDTVELTMEEVKSGHWRLVCDG